MPVSTIEYKTDRQWWMKALLNSAGLAQLPFFLLLHLWIGWGVGLAASATAVLSAKSKPDTK